MTLDERKEMETLAKILDTTPCSSKEWDEAYDRYMRLEAKRAAEYRDNNIDKLKEFYDKHIANRAWEDIDQDAWDWYSDYHKDVFGYRPRTLNWEA